MMEKTNFGMGIKSRTRGVALSAALMAGLILALVLGYIWLVNIYEQNGIFWKGRVDELWLPVLTFMGTALGGAVGVRIAGLTWRQVLLAAMLAGVYLIVAAGIIGGLSPLSPWRIDALGLSGLPIALFFILVVAAGAFLLPLCDPAVRKSGPAPSLWKVILIASVISILMMWVGVVDLYSITGVIFIGILPALGILMGLILSFTNLTDAGAWLGGFSMLIPLLALTMMLLGLRF